MTEPQPPSEWSSPSWQPPQPPDAPYGQPASNPPAYGQPSYEPPAYGQPASSPPAYVQPASGTPAYGQPVYDQPGYGQPGQPGQPGYGQTAYGQPGYGPAGYVQPYTQPVYGQPVFVSRPTNGMAIASLICSLAGLVVGISAPVGAILGHVARRQIKETGEQGDGMALAGIIVGWILTGLGICLCAAFFGLPILFAITAGAAVGSQP